MESILGLLIILLILGSIYFLPTLIVIGKGQRRAPFMFLANLLFGWTFVGWLLLMFIALFDN